MHRKQKRRQYIIYILIGILFLLSVGYAAFQQSFNIKGSTKVTSNWDVKITNVTNGTATGNAENSKDINGNTILPTWDGLSASMSADLYETGDSMEYIVTIQNMGNLDAELDSVIKNNSSNSAVIITYSGYAEGQKLYKRGSNNSSIDIKVKIEYNPEYTGGEVTGTSSISFNFKQAESKEVDGDTVISKDDKVLTYNCGENGGAESNQTSVFDIGSSVDLKVQCTKNGYTFLGWNTNKDAEAALNTYDMPNENKTLYGIYQKTINITYEKDSGITSISKNSDTCTIYNKETTCSKTLPTITLKNSNYEEQGWYIDDVFIGNASEPYTYSDSTIVKAKTIGLPVMMSGPDFQAKIASVKSTVTEIEFVDTDEVIPPTSIDNTTSWDVSDEQNESVIAWMNGTKMFIGANGKVIGNSNCSVLFRNMTNVVTIDFGNNFDTSRVTNMTSMFLGATGGGIGDAWGTQTKMLLSEIIGLESFDTSNVTAMNGMFGNCGELIELNLSSFNTSNVTNMANMFNMPNDLTSKLESIIFGTNFKTNNVTTMYLMFGDCINLRNINISNFDVSSANNLQSMFSNCQSLTELNITNFDTSNAPSMARMFTYCTNLKIIYASENFVTTNVTNSANMFLNDTNLVGGNGTVYNSNIIDKTRALIDKPGQAGYFTDGSIPVIRNVSNVTTTNSITLTVDAYVPNGDEISKIEFSIDGGATWHEQTNSSIAENIYTFTNLNANTNYPISIRATSDKGKIGIYEKYKENTFSVNGTYTSGNSKDTGYIIDWDRNFTIEETINVSSLNKRYLVIGNYDSSNNIQLNIEIYNDNKLRVWLGTNPDHINVFEGTIYANEDIDIIFNWDADSQVYNISAKGENTNISFNGNVNSNINGKSMRTLKVGAADYRSGTSPFNEIIVKKLKIIESSVKTNKLQAPTYEETDDDKITITYPEGCGSTYICAYKIASGSEVNVTTTTKEVKYTHAGILTGYVKDKDTDGNVLNTVSSTYNLTWSDLYVSNSGNDSAGYGTLSAPYATMNKAYQSAKDEATIYIMDNITTTETTNFNSNKDITLTSSDSSGNTGSSINNSVVRGSSLTNSVVSDTSGELTLENITIDGNDINGESTIISIRSDLTINEGTTIKNGKKTGNGGGLYVHADGNLLINGGEISDNKTTGHGGGIYNLGTLIINNAKILNNTAGYNNTSGSGGGIYCPNGSTLEINDGNIENNTAFRGGGFYVTGSNSTIEISGGSINNNTVSLYGGGAWATAGASLTMSGGEISGNTSGNHTGGLLIYEGASATISGTSKIQNNSSGAGTGGIGVGQSAGSNLSTLDMIGGTISGNTAATVGGGLTCSGTCTVVGGTISNNTANTNGGGIHASTGSNLTMSDGTISDNVAVRYGGGIYVNEGSTLTMSGGNILENTAARSGGGIHAIGSGTLTISGTTLIDGNKTTDTTGGNGGGVYVSGAKIFNMTGGTISNNYCAWAGGGLALGGGAEHAISGGTITRNEAALNSGGILLGNSGTKLTMTGGTISNNVAPHIGGINIYNGSTFEMNGGFIKNNTANSSTSTGGVHLEQGDGTTTTGTFTYISGVICENTPTNSYETHATCPS